MSDAPETPDEAEEETEQRTSQKRAAQWVPDEDYEAPHEKPKELTIMSPALTDYPGDEFGPVKRLLAERNAAADQEREH